MISHTIMSKCSGFHWTLEILTFNCVCHSWTVRMKTRSTKAYLINFKSSGVQMHNVQDVCLFVQLNSMVKIV